MRTEGQIRQRLKQALHRNLQKRLKANFKQKPDTCTHNRRPYHINKDGRAPCPAVCIHAKQGGQVCDERHGGVEQAKGCPLWAPLRSSDAVREEFAAGYREMAVRAKLGHKDPAFPVASTLMWVLGGETPGPELPETPTSEEGETPEEDDGDDEESDPPRELRERSLWDHPAWPWNWFND
jgi:hypothetical protein